MKITSFIVLSALVFGCEADRPRPLQPKNDLPIPQVGKQIGTNTDQKPTLWAGPDLEQKQG